MYNVHYILLSNHDFDSVHMIECHAVLHCVKMMEKRSQVKKSHLHFYRFYCAKVNKKVFTKRFDWAAVFVCLRRWWPWWVAIPLWGGLRGVCGRGRTLPHICRRRSAVRLPSASCQPPCRLSASPPVPKPALRQHVHHTAAHCGWPGVTSTSSGTRDAKWLRLSQTVDTATVQRWPYIQFSSRKWLQCYNYIYRCNGTLTIVRLLSGWRRKWMGKPKKLTLDTPKSFDLLRGLHGDRLQLGLLSLQGRGLVQCRHISLEPQSSLRFVTVTKSTHVQNLVTISHIRFAVFFSSYTVVQ